MMIRLLCWCMRDGRGGPVEIHGGLSPPPPPTRPKFLRQACGSDQLTGNYTAPLYCSYCPLSQVHVYTYVHSVYTVWPPSLQRPQKPPSFHTAFVLGFYEKWLRSKNTPPIPPPPRPPIIDAAGGWGGGRGQVRFRVSVPAYLSSSMRPPLT